MDHDIPEFKRDLICYRAMGMLRTLLLIGDLPKYIEKSAGEIAREYDLLTEQISTESKAKEAA